MTTPETPTENTSSELNAAEVLPQEIATHTAEAAPSQGAVDDRDGTTSDGSADESDEEGDGPEEPATLADGESPAKKKKAPTKEEEEGRRHRGRWRNETSVRPSSEEARAGASAVGVGDIVFGKVIEATDDVLFIDLSGKAKGIFDLRELLITEEEARAMEAEPARR